jgi:hypothetical protein
MCEEMFYLVWNPNGFGMLKVRHPERRLAEMEAERLACLNRGQQFYVLEAISVSSTPPNVITRLLTPVDEPF